MTRLTNLVKNQVKLSQVKSSHWELSHLPHPPAEHERIVVLLDVRGLGGLVREHDALQKQAHKHEQVPVSRVDWRGENRVDTTSKSSC